MNEGFWSVNYRTIHGVGDAVLALYNGVVSGVGVVGGAWDGDYTHNLGRGSLETKLTVRFPRGTISTITGKTSDGTLEERYELALPEDLEGTHKTTILGTEVVATFSKIRDFPPRH